MTKREAKRLARLTLLDEMRRTIDCTDELATHPETNKGYSSAEYLQVLEAANDAFWWLEKRWNK